MASPAPISTRRPPDALRSALAVATIVVATLLLYGTWLRGDVLLTHEGTDPYSRTQQIVEEAGRGNVPPQVLPDARAGAGTAFPRFYPPFVHDLSATIAAILDDPVRGVNFAFFLGALASGLSMFVVARILTRRRDIALGAALVYLALPYHLYDVMVRGALAESWAFAWLPLVVLGAWQTIERRRIALVLPVAFAALILTHTITALWALPLIAAVACVALARRDWRALGWLLAAGAIAGALSAWFLLPEQVELGDVFASDRTYLHASTGEVVAQRLSPSDLVGTWRNGFRGYDGESRRVIANCPLYYCGTRSWVLGPTQLIFVVASLVAGAAWLWRRRARQGQPRAPSPPLLALGVALVAGWVVSVAFVLAPRPFLAVLPAQFGYVQFPWRLLAIAGCAGAAGLALLATRVPRGGAVLCAIGVLAVATVPAAQRQPPVVHGLRGSAFTSARVQHPPTANDAGRAARGFTTDADYVPKSADGGHPAAGVPPRPVVVGGTLTRWARTDDGLTASVRAPANATVLLPITDYRFIAVHVRGASWRRADTNGLVRLRLGPGDATISVTRRTTHIELLGFVVSIAAAALLVAIALRRRRNDPAPTEPTADRTTPSLRAKLAAMRHRSRPMGEDPDVQPAVPARSEHARVRGRVGPAVPR